MKKQLLSFKPEGIYCEQADVYLDPWRKVHKALITHAHSDHARYGHQKYLSHRDSEAILRYRLGKDISLQNVDYGETININGVEFSFHPAGHIIGSSQIRVEYKGEVWVFTGDYKLENDGFSVPFEPVKCHTLISESTFGLPVYQWKPQNEIFNEINEWWHTNASNGICCVIIAYSLGKAQRILLNVNRDIGPIFTHGAVQQTNDVLINAGFQLPLTTKSTLEIPKDKYRNALIIATPSAVDTPWMRKFEPYSLGVASGWMGLRGIRRRRSADRGFILSDHADWPSLNEAVTQSEAQQVFVTHGYAHTFARWLREKGLDAQELKTEFDGDLSELNEVIVPEEDAA